MYHVIYQLDVWQRDRKQMILFILSCKDWWQLLVNDRHEICLKMTNRKSLFTQILHLVFLLDMLILISA